MSRLILSLSALAVASPALIAQNENTVAINNTPWYVQSQATHPVTGQNRTWPPTAPPLYNLGQPGVNANHQQWRVFPQDIFNRAEAREVSGFRYGGRNSAATVGANASSYIFELDLVRTTARTGGGRNPDFSAGANLVNVPSMPGGGAALVYLQNVSVAPMMLNFNEAALAVKYMGGENTDKDGNAGMGPSQTTISTWMDGPTPYVTHGNNDGGTLTPSTALEFVNWLFFFEENVVNLPYSSWGQRRQTAANPLKGHSVGTYFSDLASNPTRPPPPGHFNFGMDIRGGVSRAGHIGIMLTNIGTVFPGGFPFQGVTIEISPADGALTILTGIYSGTPLDAMGVLDTIPPISLPALRGGRGLYLGNEVVTIDPNTFQLSGSSSASWVLIN